MSDLLAVISFVLGCVLVGIWARALYLSLSGTSEKPVPQPMKFLLIGSAVVVLILFGISVAGYVPWFVFCLVTLVLGAVNFQTVVPEFAAAIQSAMPKPRGKFQLLELWPLVLFLSLYGFAIWTILTFSDVRWIGGMWFAALAIPMTVWWASEQNWRPTRFLGHFTQLVIVGALVFGACWLGNHWDVVGKMVFASPWNFGFIVVSIWVWWMYRNGWHGLNRGRALQSLFVRFLVVGVFVALLAEPRSVRTTDQLSVVYAVDISESIHRSQVEAALGFVAKTVAEKPATDEAGWIAFGNTAAVEVPPSADSRRTALMSNPNDIQFNSRVDRDATNIEQALNLASAVIDEDTRGRVVLISDGSETAGDLRPVLQQLQTRGIAVDILPIQYSYDNEVWVERLELPPSVKIGEPYEASVVISSLTDTDAELIIEENGEPYRDPIPLKLSEGKNRIDIPIYLSGPGYYEYVAKVRVPEGQDGRTENNEGVGYIFVKGEGKVLLVSDPLREDDADFERLVRAIKESERNVDVVDAYDMPRDALQLMPYDCIIYANVPHDAFDESQMQAVHDAIYNQGVGFLMVGGGNSFGPGGYHRTVIEDALPVTMDITKKKVLPKGALAIILHTCEFPEGNTWAKRITKQAIKVLGEQDEVGVIAYGPGGEQWIFDLTPAGEYEKLVPKINSASIGDMPAFGPTMQIALNGLKKSDAAAKHLIIISDGDPQAAPKSLLQEYVDNKISISTVAIFPHGGTEIGLLRTIANSTGGRYYFPADPNELPSIFIKEAKTLKRTMIQEKTFQPLLGFDSSIMDGIDGVPPLHGFVLTSLRENALTENVLYTIAEDAEEGESDPVLATWRYGLGTTAAFSSSLSNHWANDWVTWEDYRAFVKQLLMRISRTDELGHLRMWTYNAGGEGIVMVEDFHPDETFLDLAAKVNGPGDMELTIPLKQVGSRRYQGSFPINDKGRFQVTAVNLSGEREDRAYGGFIVSYSPEYLRFTSNWKTLQEIKDATGGTELTGDSTAADIFNRRAPKDSSQPVFDWFLVLLACLIPLDVAVRRIQIDWASVAVALGFSKSGESTETMGALLARKRTVSESLKQQGEEKPMQTSGTTAAYMTSESAKRKPSTTQPKKPKPASSQPPSSAGGGDGSTTSRLLDMKRKRQQDGDDK
ncbi:MAG: VWA domain-containing protein [Planctomycetaceae bacterium]